MALVFIACLLAIIDPFLPKNSKEDLFLKKEANEYHSRYKGSGGSTGITYYVRTKKFKMVTNGEFASQVSDSLPIKVYYTPILMQARRMEGRNYKEGHDPIASDNENPYAFFYWM